MTQTEALRLALEALEDLGMKHYENTGEVLYKETFTAIKAALEAKDEPWEKFCDSNCVWTDHHPDCKLAQRTWVGLTEEDEIPWDGVDAKSFAKAIEAKLKEKNT